MTNMPDTVYDHCDALRRTFFSKAWQRVKMTKILFSLLYKLESAFDRISIVRVSRKQCCCCYDMTSRPCRGWTGQSRGRERSSPAAPRLLAPRATFTCNKECYVAYNKQML